MTAFVIAPGASQFRISKSLLTGRERVNIQRLLIMKPEEEEARLFNGLLLSRDEFAAALKILNDFCIMIRIRNGVHFLSKL